MEKPVKRRIPIITLSLILSFAFTGVVEGEEEEKEQFQVPPPLIYQGIYPCSACHRKDLAGADDFLQKADSFLGTYMRIPDPTPRILVRMHRDIEFDHGDGAFWCLNCHNAQERNTLKLLNGTVISFEESYQLCGQCHGSIYRDWKLGIHGRRVGQWDGNKLYMLCAHCHNPHQPRFRKIPALDAPKPPSDKRWE